MKRGTKPKPLAIKKLEGVGKHRLNENQPQPRCAKPSCPAFLDAVARKEWRRITKELYIVGVISKLDRALLTGYCLLWSDLKRYTDLRQGTKPIVKTTAGNIIQNPLENLIHKTTERLLRYEVELGLSPSSRNRVVATSKKETDPMADILDGVRDN